jgi:hypothetical protein
MKLIRVLVGIIALLVFLPSAHADGVSVTMVFMGVNGANNGIDYVSTYYGTLNGQKVTLFCDDIINTVSSKQIWQANLTSVDSNNLSNTRYGNASISPVAANASVLYKEAAWLTTKFASNTSDYVSLQYALWDLMNPGSEPTSYGDVQNWLKLAALNYTTIDPSGFQIVTNVGPVTLTGQVQEFIIHTPEPSTVLLLVISLALLSLSMLRRSSRTLQSQAQ